jgi:hypothetical protein
VTFTLNARAGFNGTAPIEMEAAFKHGGAPVFYTSDLGVGRGRHDSALVVPVGADKTFTLEAADGETLADGVWVFALHNKGRRTVRLMGISATLE